MASTALLCYEPLLGYAHDHLFVIIMSATLNDSWRSCRATRGCDPPGSIAILDEKNRVLISGDSV